AMALRAQPRSVTRLNRRTLALLVGSLSVAVLGATIWSLQPQRRSASNQTELYNVDRVSKSEGLDALPADYSMLSVPEDSEDEPKVPELGPPLPGDLGPAIVNSQQSVVANYAPPGIDAEAAEQDARQKEAEAAAASSLFFSEEQRDSDQPTQTTKADAPTVPSIDRSFAGFDPLAAGPSSAAAQASDSVAIQNQQDQKEAFLDSDSAQTRNSGDLQLPNSPYQVMAGTVIAAALVTGITSDLPGDVIGTVTEPVYDSATGEHLL